jgi:hypothetical protein
MVDRLAAVAIKQHASNESKPGIWRSAYAHGGKHGHCRQ